MGFLGDIFGGSTKSVSSLTGQQKNLASLISYFLAPGSIPAKYQAQYSQELMGSRIGRGPTPYPDQIVPNLIPQFGQVMNLISSSSPNRFASGMQGVVNSLLGGGPSIQGPNLGAKATTDYFQKSLMAPALQEYDQHIAPRIKEAFAAGGGSFNSRLGVELGNTLSNITTQNLGALSQAVLQNQQLGAQLGFQTQQANVQNRLAYQTTGLQAAQGVTNAPLQSAALISSLLSPFQGRADTQAQAKYQEFLRQAPENSPWLQYAMGFIGQPQKAVYQQPGFLSQLTSGLGNIASLGMLGGLGGGLGGFGNLFGGGGLGSTPGAIGNFGRPVGGVYP